MRTHASIYPEAEVVTHDELVELLKQAGPCVTIYRPHCAGKHALSRVSFHFPNTRIAFVAFEAYTSKGWGSLYTTRNIETTVFDFYNLGRIVRVEKSTVPYVYQSPFVPTTEES